MAALTNPDEGSEDWEPPVGLVPKQDGGSKKKGRAMVIGMPKAYGLGNPLPVRDAEL